MATLKDIDSKAAEKGSALTTIWQFAKFIVVSLLAMIVQFALLNLLKLLPPIQELYASGQDFRWWVFFCPAAIGGLGYFIVNNTANIAAQIVVFCQPRKNVQLRREHRRDASDLYRVHAGAHRVLRLAEPDAQKCVHRLRLERRPFRQRGDHDLLGDPVLLVFPCGQDPLPQAEGGKNRSRGITQPTQKRRSRGGLRKEAPPAKRLFPRITALKKLSKASALLIFYALFRRKQSALRVQCSF